MHPVHKHLPTDSSHVKCTSTSDTAHQTVCSSLTNKKRLMSFERASPRGPQPWEAVPLGEPPPTYSGARPDHSNPKRNTSSYRKAKRSGVRKHQNRRSSKTKWRGSTRGASYNKPYLMKGLASKTQAGALNSSKLKIDTSIFNYKRMQQPRSVLDQLRQLCLQRNASSRLYSPPWHSSQNQRTIYKFKSGSISIS